MPTTLTQPIERTLPSLPRWALSIAVAVAVAIALAAFGSSNLLRGPRFVAGVTVDNPSPYAIDLQVTDSSRDGWMLLGVAAPQSTLTVNQVVDQGATWVFRVQSQGIDAGEFALSRADLAASGWRITIPTAVIGRLQAQNISVSPKPTK
jgi:hypothetical protein